MNEDKLGSFLYDHFNSKQQLQKRLKEPFRRAETLTLNQDYAREQGSILPALEEVLH